MDWKKESESFNKAADYYDKFRPSYPKELIAYIEKKTQIKTGSKLLEIGAGSGKSTELFINKGYYITCIEPGKDLVKMGQEKFMNTDDVSFVTSRFEDWNEPKEAFDVVFSAQAFHWVPKPIGYEKSANSLKAGGYLALFWNMYPIYDNETDKALFNLSNQFQYGLCDFLTADGCEKRIQAISDEIINCGFFNKPEVLQFPWEQRYTAEEYIGFLSTGNSYINMYEHAKNYIKKEIEKIALLDNGIIRRPYLCVLYLAEKKAS